MGRISLIVLFFIFSGLELSAQSGNSNLEFVENKGQWNEQVRFRAEMSAGAFFLQSKGYMVVLNDTTDLRRIQRILHGSPGAGNAFVPGGTAGVQHKTVSQATGAVMKGRPPEGGSGGAGGLVVSQDMVLHSHAYRVSFENANEHAPIVPEKVMASYNNYFIGDRSHWVSKAKIYQGITYQNIYEGIDLHYYSDGGFLKYDLVVHPGADPSRILLKYEGQDRLSIKRGQLLVKTSVSTVKELEPRSYQVDGKGRAEVVCSYVIRDGNKVGFKLGNYDPAATLVIDPTEVFCTFTGSKSDNWGYTSTFDAAGNFYAGGITIDYVKLQISGSNFGATTGAFQRSFQGGDNSEGIGNGEDYHFDVAIMKFDGLGKTALYATYIGGSGNEQPHSMICDDAGNLIVTGRTTSADFPPAVFTPGFAHAKFDIFIAKLSADGSGLIGSLKIGGDGDDGVNYSPKYVNSPGNGTQDLRLNYGDDGRGEVILDAAGNIYVASCTQSTNFPCTRGFQTVSGGGQDGVIIKTNPSVSTVLASTYIGGNGSDAAFSLALNPLNNDLYVSGGTMSTDLKGVSGISYQGAKKGGVDGFVSIIGNNAAGLSLLKTTYFGTDGTDMIYGVQFDKEGFPYIMGTTSSVIPVVNSPFNQSNNQARGKQFITKLQPDLSAIVYSANFGPANTNNGWPNLSPTAFLVDRCENVYISGWGGGIDPGENYDNSGTSGLVTTKDAIKGTTDGADFYFFVLQKNAASQLYGSFFGQPGGKVGDHVDGGTSRFDKQGIIYQSICANCEGPDNIFPVTPNVWARHNGAVAFGGCNEAAVKIAFNFAGVSAGLKLSLRGRGDSLGCAPLEVALQDTIRNAKSYIWRYGDGSADNITTDYSVTHTYLNVGVYQVMLIAIDSNSCNVADTVYRTVTVKDNKATLDFAITKNAPCTANSYDFTNNSSFSGSAPPFKASSFFWDFGDGTGLVPAPIPVGSTEHSYANPGPYTTKLILVDTNYCNYPDTLYIPLYVAQNVKAQFETPATGCAPYLAVFNNTSIAGQTYIWDFGDQGPTSTDMTPPPHLYPDPGSYTITLTVTDPNTCNKTDTYSATIILQSKPTAAFTFAPSPPVANTPMVFTNGSSPDAVRFDWIFGDGESAVKLTADTVMHQYNRTDTFQACLIATNASGCTDTICHPVAALINPLLDVPNAFTPGRFGQNGVVKVVGFGITHMNFRIYNRWGQMVFQSNDRNTGWDGTYKGALQPMDVYAYTLEVEYFDGTHVSKKGDITLIR